MKKTKALLIVDMQNDFCPGGALAVPEGDKIVPIINKLITEFPVISASKDWHPPDSVHFQKWPVHCVADTTGADFHSELDTNSIDLVLLKGTFNKDNGYSAFEATNIDFVHWLHTRNVTDLFVCGLATDYCVKASCLDAVREGFHVFLIENAIRGVDLQSGDSEKAISDMYNAGVKITDSEGIG